MGQATEHEPTTLKSRAMALIATRPVIRSRDFSDAGIPRNYLQRLTREGVLVQVGRGLYEAADRSFSTGSSLAEVALSSPKATIALLSALQLHDLTTQTPHAVWILLGGKDWAPTSAPTKLEIVRASGSALTAGVDRHRLDGVDVPVTNPAKTIADCFRYRSRVGIDLAIEALRDGLGRKKVKLDELWTFARICRVQTVMRPYLQAIV